MVQLGDRPGLAVKAGEDLRPGRQHLGTNDLEGDAAIQLGLHGLEDHAHAALPDGKLQPVRANDQFFAVARKELCLLVSRDPVSLHQLGA